MKKKKRFKITFEIETDAKVREDDINITSSDVIDGFEVSRNNRLGDITSNFHLNTYHNFKVEEIKI